MGTEVQRKEEKEEEDLVKCAYNFNFVLQVLSLINIIIQCPLIPNKSCYINITKAITISLQGVPKFWTLFALNNI